MRLIISAIIFLTAFLAAKAVLIVYPAPEGTPLSDAFQVAVRQNSQPWQNVDVYAIKVDSTDNGKHNVVLTSVAMFDFDGTAQVRVVSRKHRVDSARVRPLSYGIEPTVKGDTLTFTIDRPRQLSVEVNGLLFSNLQLFANPIDTRRPANLKKWARQKGHIYYPPGYHKLDTVQVIGGGTEVYIDGGAWIDGFFHIKGDGVDMHGRGVIMPAGRGEGIKVMNSRDVRIEGLLTTQCPVGGSDRVGIDNVKVMSSYGWGDGFNVFASNNVTYRNIFARTSDDCTTIYATRKGFKGGAQNILTENAVLWADVAHPIMIGLHGAAAEIGPDAPADTISNITYRNIDILDHKESQLDYQGCIAISCGDNNVVRDITFDRIDIDNFRQGQLLNIRIFFNKKYCAAPGTCIENIRLNDVTYNGDRSELSMIIGYDESRKVRGVHFNNLRINGELIHDKMPGKLPWFKTSDMARIFVGEHVEDVTFSIDQP